MKLEEINKEWCEAFVSALNEQQAAVVFCFGITKDGKIRACQTTDIDTEKLYKYLIHIAALLPVEKGKLKFPEGN